MDNRFVYVFKDAGYDIGVKIGRGVRSNLASAQSYAPRRIEMVAAWRIAADQASKIETECTAGLPRLTPEGIAFEAARNGKEWFNLCAGDAIDALTKFFHRPPDEKAWEITNPGDIFQSPISRPGRMMIFCHKEHLTGRLKVHATSEWQSPLERRRRYSRNGFAQMMAFTHMGKMCSLELNNGVLSTWRRIVDRFAENPNNCRGWLSRRATRDSVRDVALAGGFLTEIDDIQTSAGRPPGVRTRYNASGSIPDAELALFAERWW